MRSSRRSSLLWLPLLALVAEGVPGGLRGGDGTPQEPFGIIAGVVRFTGKVPPPKEVVTTDGSTIRHSDLVVDGKTRGLRYVVAALEDAPARPRVGKAEPVLVDQRDMLFVPRVVAVQHGRAVRF